MLSRLLEALDEPALLLARSGAVRGANAAALRLFGRRRADDLVGRRLDELTADEPAAIERLLRASAGSRQPTVGSLAVAGDAEAGRRIEVRGARLDDGPAPDGAGPVEPLLLLRFQQEAARERFRALTEKVVALNAEISHRRRVQVQLEAAVEQRATLLRELHHRVKNNLQVLLGMLAIAERQAVAAQARDAIRDARMRVEAMAVLQRMLYGGDEVGGVEAGRFLRELCTSVERAFRRPGVALSVEPCEARLGLDAASGVGLVVNELLTNAFKHAFPDGREGRISVGLRRADGRGGEAGDAYVLVVEDDGPGFDPRGADGGTGLTLVRGLAGQHGGACALESAPGRGTRCTVTLRDRGRPRQGRLDG